MLSFALAKASKGLLHLVHYDLFDYLMNQKKKILTWNLQPIMYIFLYIQLFCW